MIAVWLKIDGERLVSSIEEAREKLDAAEGEIVLDFSSVSRMDTSSVKAIKQLAESAGEKGISVVLRGVSVEVYKLLKLMNLAARFSFAN